MRLSANPILRGTSARRLLCAALFLGAALFFAASAAESHETQSHSVRANGIVGDWLFRPQYMLPRNAAHVIAGGGDVARSSAPEFSRDSLPLKLCGQAPTERLLGLVEPDHLPPEAFTFEAWLNHHVNRPVGFAAIASDPNAPAGNACVLAHHTLQGDTARTVAQFPSEHEETPLVLSWDHASRGYKKYWWHIALTYDGREAKLYVNGEQRAAAPAGRAATQSEPSFEIAGYFAHEPHMRLSNFLHAARLYDRALSSDELGNRFAELKSEVD
ncbi:MAG: LamG-like jellyroll fold domain-containing protein, partial [Planctomycetota bacterium]